MRLAVYWDHQHLLEWLGFAVLVLAVACMDRVVSAGESQWLVPSAVLEGSDKSHIQGPLSFAQSALGAASVVLAGNGESVALVALLVYHLDSLCILDHNCPDLAEQHGCPYQHLPYALTYDPAPPVAAAHSH